MFFELTLLNAILTLIYGICLVFIPDFFMGVYIYKHDIWRNFQMIDSNIPIGQHLLTGCGLTWVWVSFCYFLIANITSNNLKSYGNWCRTLYNV